MQISRICVIIQGAVLKAINAQHGGRSSMYLSLKRTFDVVGALVILIVTSPIYLLVTVAIKLEDKGPAIFKQTRSGRYGKDFTLYKFRSMSISNDVRDFKVKDSLTKTGKIIRRLSIDELPQLINILKGDMSFIGPRPWIIDYMKYFNKEQMKRLDVRPGITGYAQAMGRNSLSITEKINYDLQYVENISLIMDIKVIYYTLKTMFIKDSVDIGKNGIKEELEYLKANLKKSTN